MRPAVRLGSLVLALVTVVVVGPAQAGLADRLGATFTLMADDFVRASVNWLSCFA